MSNDYSRGPWDLHVSDRGNDVRVSIVAKAGDFIASLIAPREPVYLAIRQRANAKLIQAAPELLAMLDESIQREWNPFEPNNQSQRYHRMVALRIKATGSAS